jgi:hypothetical protein
MLEAARRTSAIRNNVRSLSADLDLEIESISLRSLLLNRSAGENRDHAVETRIFAWKI